MYKCEVCSACSAPKAPRLVFTIYRDTPLGKQIAREVALCVECHNMLKEGLSFNKLAAHHGCPIRTAGEGSRKAGRKPIKLGKPLPPKTDGFWRGESYCNTC